MDTVRDWNIDQPVFTTNWNGWFGAFFSQWVQAGTCAAAEDKAYYFNHGSVGLLLLEEQRYKSETIGRKLLWFACFGWLRGFIFF
jgi:hypothetical protein